MGKNLGYSIVKHLGILMLVGLTVSAGQPLSKIGGLPGAALRMGFGPEGIGTGNAFIAARSQEIAGYYNPALLPFQESPIAFVSMSFLSLDRNLNFLGYSNSIEPSGGIALGIINAGVSNIDGRDPDGKKTGTLSTSENAFFLSFGTRVSPIVSIGITTKILYYHLYEGVSSTTAGFDLGGVIVLTNELTLGGSIQDLASKYKWDTSSIYGLQGNSTVNRFPLRKRLGLSFASTDIPLFASVEIENLQGMTLLRGGVSFDLIEPFTLRAGLDQISLSDYMPPKPAFGFTSRTTIGSLLTFISYTFVLEPYSPSGIHVLAVGINLQ